ncbi:hypothetical protein GCM10009760_45130 [Kitasatospora kazusensis]|uniref:Carrier domain-containing protein n=1 Tax=Kitasatospora kazusensis TaxID=407974 RepID=A0ABN2ZZ61_9ACTN
MTGTTAVCSVTQRLRDALLDVSGVTPELLFGDPDGDGGDGGAGGGTAEELEEDLQLVDDLGFDSVMLMELKSRLEQHFPALGELTLPEVLPSLRTVGSIVGFLKRRLSSAGAL